MAFAELKRLKAKIRQGSATTEEIEKYRDMMPDRNDESEDSDARLNHDQPKEQEKRQQVVSPANENGSRHHVLPVLETPDAKRQRLMVINSYQIGVAEKEGMGQFQKDGANYLGGPGPVVHGLPSTPCQPNYAVHGSSLALFDALRASKATRGHHQLSKTMFSSVVDQLKSNPQDEEGVRAARRLTGMKGTAAIMSPFTPSALSSAAGLGSSASASSSCNTSTDMSARHILRRIGNPHRRVVHQMLREQNERILYEMKRKTTESMSRPSSSGALAAAVVAGPDIGSTSYAVLKSAPAAVVTPSSTTNLANI